MSDDVAMDLVRVAQTAGQASAEARLRFVTTEDAEGIRSHDERLGQLGGLDAYFRYIVYAWSLYTHTHTHTHAHTHALTQDRKSVV